MAYLAQKFRDIYYPYRIFSLLSITFLGGILVAAIIPFDFGRSWPVFIYLTSALASVGLLNYLFKSKLLALLSFSLLTLSLGLSYYSYREWRNQIIVPFDTELKITGTIAERVEIDPKGQKITPKITSAVLDGAEQPALRDSKIIVSGSVFPEYHFGEILQVEGQIKEAQNYSDFDYKAYLKHLYIIGEVKSPVKIEYIGDDTTLHYRFYASLYSMVDRFKVALDKILPEPHSSLAAGILLGVKSDMPDDLMQNLQKTGLTHIIALSGFNVTILMAVFAGSLTIYLGRRYTFILGVLLVSVFVLMTGASASVVRAAIFSVLILFGKTIGRRADQLNLILLTGLVMVVINPYLLPFDLGFQLSFLAFIGLIYFAPLFQNLFQKPKFNFMPKQLGQPLAETLGAQMAVFPLIIVKFGIVSIISPLANLLVVWIVPWIMLLTFLTGLISIVATPLGRLFIILLWPCLEYILRVINFLANLPFSSIKF